MDNRKVGRPRLADKSLKKKSLIISVICLVIILILIGVGLTVLNIPPFKKMKGKVPIYKTYEIGDKFCLNDDRECFYVIEDNGDNVTALAEWNLNVGDNKNPNVQEGVQDESIIGENPVTNKYGYIIFSSESYWSVEDSESLKPEYGTTLPAFVFDSNSNLWEPLQNYQTYLRGLKYESVEVTLLSYEQAVNLGCDPVNETCINAPYWVYQTSYWTGSVEDYWWDIWPIYLWPTSTFGSCGSQCECDNSNSKFGLRPVIIIAKDDFAEIIGYEEETTTSEEITTTEGTTKKVETKVKETTSNTTKKILRKKTTNTTTKGSTTISTTTEETSKVKIAKIESTKKSKEENKTKSYPMIGIGIILGISLIGSIVYIKGKK